MKSIVKTLHSLRRTRCFGDASLTAREMASLAGAFLDGGISEHLRRQSQRHGSRRGRELEMP
jgi:hypothetical protein